MKIKDVIGLGFLDMSRLTIKIMAGTIIVALCAIGLITVVNSLVE